MRRRRRRCEAEVELEAEEHTALAARTAVSSRNGRSCIKHILVGHNLN
jgi:hypothetical protein